MSNVRAVSPNSCMTLAARWSRTGPTPVGYWSKVRRAATLGVTPLIDVATAFSSVARLVSARVWPLVMARTKARAVLGYRVHVGHDELAVGHDRRPADRRGGSAKRCQLSGVS